MDENRVEGAVTNITGKVKDAAGGLVGDTSTQLKGKADQVAGKAQESYGQTVEALRDFTSDQPITAVMTAVVVGVVLGFILGRR